MSLNIPFLYIVHRKSSIKSQMIASNGLIFPEYRLLPEGNMKHFENISLSFHF